MRSTCIHHPAHERLLIIRQWQLEFCEGNHCAAALLSLFEYWHNIRLDMRDKARQANQIAERHGAPGGQDESLLQFHSDDQLRAGLLRLYGTKKMRTARRLLAAKGVITECANPNPRYKFDKTVYFYFHPQVVNAWITSQGGRQLLPEPPRPPSGADGVFADGRAALFVATVPACGKNAERIGKNADVHTEITTETTTEITTTTPNPSSSYERAVEPETVCRGGGGQDEQPKDQDGNPEAAAQEPTEEQPVSQEEAQAAPAIEASSDTPTETPKTVAREEGANTTQLELNAEGVNTTQLELNTEVTNAQQLERNAEGVNTPQPELTDPTATPAATLDEVAYTDAQNTAQKGLKGAIQGEPHSPPSPAPTEPPAALQADLAGVINAVETILETPPPPGGLATAAPPANVPAAARPADTEAAADEALVYPAKLTEREQNDIAQQVSTLPAEIAQPMLDVIASKLHGSQIRTNAAAVLRGMVRKYRADPASFDPSPGFHVAENRRQRAEAEARLRAAEAAQRRQAEASVTPPLRRSPAESEGYRYFREMTRKILRGR